MQTGELKEYLGIVVDMKKSIFLQKNLTTNIALEIDRLKTPQKFVDPPEPIKPQISLEPVQQKLPHSRAGIIGGCIALLFTGTLGMMIVEGISQAMADWAEILTLIPPIIWTIYCVVENNGMKQEIEKKEDAISEAYQRDMKRYREQRAEYENKLKENQINRDRDEAEREAKTILLNKQAEGIEKSLAISEEHLQKIYEKDIIFPKYRNLVMACSLYEYVCAGRCTELEGHEGAYNILESEIRFDRIVSQLNQVVAHLEQIQKNQFMLYSAMKESNQRSMQIRDDFSRMVATLEGVYRNTSELNAHTAQLSAHIDKLQETSALTAYQTERAQKELAYMNRMDYLSGRNDDVFFNHPPV